MKLAGDAGGALSAKSITKLVFAVVLVATQCAVMAQAGTWTQETAAAAWSGRLEHGTAVFKNRLWVLGGHGTGILSDVWSSPDGLSWTLETSSAPWKLLDVSALAFGGKLWVLGGNEGNAVYKNDIWYSDDGIGWQMVSPAPPWNPRFWHQSIVFQGRMWILGGRNSTHYNDVWSSADGFSWTRETAAAPWSVRSRHSAVVFQNRIWVMGGSEFGSHVNDVWSSADGVSWVQETAAANWSPRGLHRSVAYANLLWVLGGSTGSAEIWHSADGKAWQQQGAGAPWPSRLGHGAELFSGKLWVLGGNNSVPPGSMLNDVWSYWEQMPLQVQSIPTIPEGRIGVPLSLEIAAAGGLSPYSWSIQGGALPPGLGLVASSTDRITVEGVPSQPGSYSWTIKVDDSLADTASQTFSITILPIEIKSAGVPAGTVNKAYSAGIEAVGGFAPFSWSVSQGTLPPGLALSSTNSQTVYLSGTPTTTGQFSFTVRVEDSMAFFAEKALTIEVKAAPPPKRGGGGGSCSLTSSRTSSWLCLTIGVLGVCITRWRFRSAQ